jgi:hypothetical protein
MIIDGISQSKDGIVEYTFTLREACDYELTTSAMETIRVNSAQLSIDSDIGCNGRITMEGIILFSELKGCDLLSYQQMAYSNLQLLLPENAPLRMEYDKLAINHNASSLREQSFGKRFACELEKVLYQVDQMPDELGYETIAIPVSQSKLLLPWAGLVWRLSLGSLGELSNSGELNIRILIAWSMGEKAPAYYVGVSLPGIMDGFNLQGIVKLGFQSVELMVTTKEDIVQYTLRLHNYTLRLLWLAIPPGSNDLFIFADGKKLGWYAAYQGEDKECLWLP